MACLRTMLFWAGENSEHKVVPMPNKCFLKDILFNLNILKSKQISVLVVRQKSPE